MAIRKGEKGKNGKPRYVATIVMHKAKPNRHGTINYKAILGETKGPHQRSRVVMSETPSAFKVTIEADDAAALMAAFGSITRDIRVIEGATIEK